MLSVVPEPSFEGEAGARQLRALQDDMAQALAQSDFERVRRLDQTASRVLDKLIAANPNNRQVVLNAMGDLKSVYADMIEHCRRQAAVSSL